MGSILLWCAITDRSPIDVTKAVFTGKDIPKKGTWSGIGSQVGEQLGKPPPLPL